MRSRLGPFLIPLAIVLLIGGMFTAFGIVMLRETVNAVARMAHGHGTVVSLVKSSRSRSNAYAPTIEFTAEDGRTYRFTSDVYSSPPTHQEGDQVDVLYDPLNPTAAKVDSFVSLWLLPLVFGSLGIIAVAIVLAVAVRKLMQ